MSVITISGTTGGTPPLSVYLCDEYGNNCYLISTTGGTYTLNSFYSSANTLMVKTVDSTGCEYFELVSCYEPPPTPTDCKCYVVTNSGRGEGSVEYLDCNTLNITLLSVLPGETIYVCSVEYPIIISGYATVVGITEYFCNEGVCESPTPTPTATPTPTCDPSTVHPYYTPFGSSTNITGYFYTSFLSACTAFNCVTGSTCAVNAAFLVYLDESEPQIGSILYSNNVGCSPTLLTGCFLVQIGGSPTYNAIAEVTTGVITDLPSCP